METNVNFRKDLMVEYLSSLVAIGNIQEFDRFYPSIEEYLVQLAKESQDLTVLNKVNSIFAFRQKNMGIQL